MRLRRRLHAEEEVTGTLGLHRPPPQDSHLPLSRGLLGSRGVLETRWDPVEKRGHLGLTFEPGQHPTEDPAPCGRPPADSSLVSHLEVPKPPSGLPRPPLSHPPGLGKAQLWRQPSEGSEAASPSHTAHLCPLGRSGGGPQPPVLTALPKTHHVQAGGCWQVGAGRLTRSPGGPSGPGSPRSPRGPCGERAGDAGPRPKPPRTAPAPGASGGSGGFPRSTQPQLRLRGAGPKTLGISALRGRDHPPQPRAVQGAPRPHHHPVRPSPTHLQPHCARDAGGPRGAGVTLQRRRRK